MRKKAANKSKGQRFRSLDDVRDVRELLVGCSEEIKVRVVWTDGRPAEKYPIRFDPAELTVDQACEQYKQALQASVAHLVADCTCGQFHGVISVTQVRSLSE
jgi:hypothetical protein